MIFDVKYNGWRVYESPETVLTLTVISMLNIVWPVPELWVKGIKIHESEDWMPSKQLWTETTNKPNRSGFHSLSSHQSKSHSVLALISNQMLWCLANICRADPVLRKDDGKHPQREALKWTFVSLVGTVGRADNKLFNINNR